MENSLPEQNLKPSFLKSRYISLSPIFIAVLILILTLISVFLSKNSSSVLTTPSDLTFAKPLIPLKEYDPALQADPFRCPLSAEICNYKQV